MAAFDVHLSLHPSSEAMRQSLHLASTNLDLQCIGATHFPVVHIRMNLPQHRILASTGPCPDFVRTYRSFFLRPALPSAQQMSTSLQLEKPCLSFRGCQSSVRNEKPRARVKSTGAVPSYASEANKSLIATMPRLEIVVICSYQRRKHFLTATRNAFSNRPDREYRGRESLASGQLVPASGLRYLRSMEGGCHEA